MAIVSIEDNKFNPANVTIAHGSMVMWTNNGANMAHTVTSNGHAGVQFKCTPISTEDFDSGTIAHSAAFEHAFPNAVPTPTTARCTVARWQGRSR